MNALISNRVSVLAGFAAARVPMAVFVMQFTFTSRHAMTGLRE